MVAQLVFVHGVYVRKDRDPVQFDKDVAERHRRLQKFMFEDVKVNVRDPYWGKFGADPKHNLASIPLGSNQALGGLGGIGQAGGSSATDRKGLLKNARTDFDAVINSLAIRLVEDAETKGASAVTGAEELAASICKYALGDPDLSWLDQMADDEAFLDKLEAEVKPLVEGATEDLGLGSVLKSIGRNLVGGASNLINSPVAAALRSAVPHVAIFIGDVFKYLKDGSPRDDIRDVVLADIGAAARDASVSGEPLFLVGHSMGGVILYDLLSDTNAMRTLEADLGFPLEVDLLLTVGSQPALFEELGLFKSSSPDNSAQSGTKADQPAVVKRWWNVFDRMDVLAFATERVFEDTKDFELDTIASVAGAHTAYFKSQMFYQRLHKRLDAEGLLV